MTTATLDFSRSWMRFRIDLTGAPITLSHKPPTTENNVRIALEARCSLTELSTGRRSDYVLTAACKTERVGGPGPLWLEPNADFCMVLSAEEFLILKSWQKNDMAVMRYPASLGVQPERQAGLVGEAWNSCSIECRAVEGTVLDGYEAAVRAIRGDRPLVSRTSYEDSGFRVVIEHPVKTVNFSAREPVFQTDTGPVPLPDFTRKRERLLVEAFDLAFSAFNSPGWTEFVVNVPTPVAPGVSVNHYSRLRRVEPAVNEIIEVKGS